VPVWASREGRVSSLSLKWERARERVILLPVGVPYQREIDGG
jgi:hypothetical protein